MQGWVDIFSLSWVVPLILDSMMAVATAVYDYFVDGGMGIISVLIWGFVAMSISLYLVKMYFPENYIALFGLKGGGEMYKSDTTAWSIAGEVWKPMLRALFAMAVLLQIQPVYITRFVIDPFLEFGAVYVGSITGVVLPNPAAPKAECPEDLGDYLSKSSCEFLVRPIDDISRVNNTVIRRGLEFLVMPGIMNVITGLVLIATFFMSNLFMALLIVKGIINFGMELILYPFKVLIFVVNPSDKKVWLKPWDAVGGLVASLKNLIVAMIAVAFMLLVNISVAGAMLGFDIDSSSGFGAHSITWTASILSFWIMFEVFKITREKLKDYVKDDMSGFYNQVADRVKTVYKNTAAWGKRAIGILGKK